MTLRHNYRDLVVAIIDRILAEQSDALDAARDAIAGALAGDGVLHVAGSGHSHMLAEEVFYRAGGLAAAQAILDEDLMLHRGAVRSTQLERDSGRAEAALERYRIAPGDVVIVASNSGRNAYPVELAQIAREKGAVVIALTSLAHSRAVPSRHSSGKRLFELADIVLDNGGELGDAALDVPGLGARMGPTSSVIGLWLLNALVAEAAEQATARGGTVDVYVSANADRPGESIEDIAARWSGRIAGL
ncbi:MAG: SIS domain-containing protein [Rubellimicrobium sp.]|nr:SIS domain-containing protein [Rubellimicrobium sp.]